MLKQGLMLLMAVSAGFASQRWVAFDESKSAGSAMEIQVIRADPDQITLHVSVPGMWVKDTVVQGITFQRIFVPGMPGGLGELGSPELPRKSRFFALPPSAGAVLKVSNVKHRVLTDYLIFPDQGEEEDKHKQGFSINPQVYASESHFPQRTDSVGEPAVMRNVRMGKAYFCPFQYNPAKRVLKAAREFTVTITFSDVDMRHDIAGFPTSVAPQIDGICRAVLLGYDGVYGRSRTLSEWNNTYDRYYLLIVAQYWAENSAANGLDDFVDWLKRKGYCVSVEIITGGGSQDVWNLIHNWYDNRIRNRDLYVLLIGDIKKQGFGPGTSDNKHIATYGGYPYIPFDPEDDTDFYSDYIYSTMGEPVDYPDNLDDIADLALGRWCPETNGDLGNIINKQFDFERNVPGSWATEDILFVAPYGDNPYHNTKDSIYHNLLYGDVDCQTEYYDGLNKEAAKQNIRNALQTNEGLSVINYRGHGFRYGWDPTPNDTTTLFDCFDISGLNNNGWYPMVFSVACLTGYLTMTIPDDWPPQAPPPKVMLKAWTNHTHGAVGAWGSSCVTRTPNNGVLDSCLFKGFYNPDEWQSHYPFDVGYGINYAKTRLIEDPPTPDALALQDARSYYWIGDPGLWAWEDRVAESSDMTITVTIDSETFVNPDTLPTNTEVAVELELTWTDGANSGYEVYADVSLYKKDGAVDFIQHRASGAGVVGFNAVTFEYPGWLYITVLRPRQEPNFGSPYAMTPIEDSIYFKNMGLNSDVEEPVQPIVWSVSCNRTIFSNRVAFNYSTPQTGQVSLKLYDASGRLLTAFNRDHEAVGYYKFIWNGRDKNNARLPSGVYFFIFEGEDYCKQGKVTLLR